MQINWDILEKFFLLFDKKISDKEKKFLLKWEIFWDLEKNISSKIYLEKFSKYKFLFSICPFIKWIFIWNTIAFWSAKGSSDIDLFIVLENWKIWTWRLLLSFLLQIFWVRRHWKKTKWRFCLSFFASEKWAFELANIQIEKNKDIYLAIWTTTLIPVFWDKKFFEEFFENNKWVENYGLSDPGVGFQRNLNKNIINKNIFIRDPGVGFLEKILNFNFIENFLRKILKLRSENKKNKIKNNYWIIISEDYLKFHDNDKRKEIMEKFI